MSFSGLERILGPRGVVVTMLASGVGSFVGSYMVVSNVGCAVEIEGRSMLPTLNNRPDCRLLSAGPHHFRFFFFCEKKNPPLLLAAYTQLAGVPHFIFIINGDG
jgi:hypothetical protein